MKKQVSAHFEGYQDCEVKYGIAEGALIEQLLKKIVQKDIDLVIAGKKCEDRRSSSLAEKLCRKAPCSVLLLPDNAQPKISNIVVPVDFSQHAENAMDVASAFAAAADIKEIAALHMYTVPLGYHKIGKSYEEFADIMKNNAIESYEEFIKRCQLKGVKAVPQFILEKKVVRGIQDAVIKIKPDLLVIGARGRRGNSGILLGSVTERLIWVLDIPILAAKNKNEGMSILEALYNL
jgi:nucleotide-binding universal stress UspA family protein